MPDDCSGHIEICVILESAQRLIEQRWAFTSNADSYIHCHAAEAGKPPTIPAVPVSVTIPIALNPKKKLKFKLAEKHQLSHNVRRYRFALPSVQHKFGLPVGKHVFLYAK